MTSTEALQMFDPAMKMTNDESPFCVNGGSCHRVDNTGIDQQQNDYYCLCVGDPRGGEMLWTGKRCEVVNLEEGTTLAPTPSFTESSPVVVPEPPTLTTGPTIPETPRPTASVPVVTCGDLDCRYVQNVVGILSTQHNTTHTHTPGSLFSLSLSLSHTLDIRQFSPLFFFSSKNVRPSLAPQKEMVEHASKTTTTTCMVPSAIVIQQQKWWGPTFNGLQERHAKFKLSLTNFVLERKNFVSTMGIVV